MINEIMRSEYAGLFIVAGTITTAYIAHEWLKIVNSGMSYGYSMSATTNYGNIYFTPGSNSSPVQSQIWPR